MGPIARLLFKEVQHMSRVVPSPTGHPTSSSPSSTPSTPVKIPHDKIAMRAYEKWVKRGRPHGTDQQDWAEAEAELKAEHARMSGSPAGRR
jgi:hypothetical protein